MKELARLRWLLLAGLVVAGVSSSLVAVFLFREGWGAALLNLGTEFIGAVAVYFVFELIIERREQWEAKKQAVEARKADLVAQMGSGVNDVAVAAAEELEHKGWLYDGALRGAVLVGASLSKAELLGAALPSANLMNADLSEARLDDANLQGAKLHGANLSGAFLIRANLTNDAGLSGACLCGAKLQGADLTGSKLAFLDADLSEADLSGAKVTPEQLARARSLEGATLPDGTKLSEDKWEAEFEEWRKKQEGQGKTEPDDRDDDDRDDDDD